jgi:bisphosphoglycerate-independent phosphoglycerate mutase (AlkP superfamily)
MLMLHFSLMVELKSLFLNETRVLIPSPSVATYDLQPEMSAPQVGDAVKNCYEKSN